MKNLLNSIKLITLALIIGLGVSYVSAFTPGTSVPAIIDTSVNDQTKDGGILSEKWFASDLSFFTETLLPGNDSWMNIGGGNSTLTPADITNNGSTIPLTIDLKDRTKTTKTVLGQNAINFISGQTQCAQSTALINDRAPAFEFMSGTNHADLVARQLQLQGGTPRDNSVLAAVDDQGNAVWARLVIDSGTLKVIDNKTGLPIPSTGVTSPVVTNTNCSIFDMCPNISETQTTIPSGMIIDKFGKCVTATTKSYRWVTGDWSCPSSASPSWKNANYPDGNFGQSCSSWVLSNTNTAKTRRVQCEQIINGDPTGIYVSDTFCIEPKPSTTSTNQGICPIPNVRDVFNSAVSFDKIFDGSCAYVKPVGGTFFGGCVQGQNAPDSTYKPTSHCKTEPSSGTFIPCYGPPGSSTSGCSSTILYGDFIENQTQIFN